MSPPTPAELWVWSNNSGISVSVDSTVFWRKFLFSSNGHVIQAECSLCQNFQYVRDSGKDKTLLCILFLQREWEREKNKIGERLFDVF